MNPYARTLRKVSDPLRDETRKIRKVLLLWSLAALAMTVGGLFPAEISALGLKIAPTSKATLFWLVVAVLTYHLVAFVAYASADAAHWYVNLRSTDWEEDVASYDTYKSELLARSKFSQEDRDYMEEHERRLGALWRGEASRMDQRLEAAAPYISTVRAAIDFALPPLFGSAAVAVLIHAARSAA